jgi:hypothetical protein
MDLAESRWGDDQRPFGGDRPLCARIRCTVLKEVAYGMVPGSCPPPEPETRFADWLQDCPSETVTMAREFKAFVRANPVKPPQPLLRVVFVAGGLATSLQETAADFTLLYDSLTDSAIAARFAACRPWMQAVLAKMLHTTTVATLPAPWRFLVILRMSPTPLSMYGGDGQRVDLMPVLREHPWEPRRTMDVRGQAPSLGEVCDSSHANRRSEAHAQGARQRIRPQSRKTGRTPKDPTLCWAGWVLVLTTVAPAVLWAETISALYRVRWPIAIAINRWKRV